MSNERRFYDEKSRLYNYPEFYWFNNPRAAHCLGERLNQFDDTWNLAFFPCTYKIKMENYPYHHQFKVPK